MTIQNERLAPPNAPRIATVHDLDDHLFYLLKHLPVLITRRFRKISKNRQKMRDIHSKRKIEYALISYEEYKNLLKIKELAEKLNILPPEPVLPTQQEEELIIPPKMTPKDKKSTNLLEQFLKSNK